MVKNVTFTRNCSGCGTQVDLDHPGTIKKEEKYYHGGCIPIQEQHQRIAEKNGTKGCPKCHSSNTTPDTCLSSHISYDCNDCGHHFL